MNKTNRFQVAMGAAVLLAIGMISVILFVPSQDALTIIRATGIGLSAMIAIGYAPALNPLPFLNGTAKSEHITAAGMVFFALSILILLGRPTFFETACRMGTGCYNYVLAAVFFFFVLGGMTKIAGPLVYQGLRGRDRVRFYVAIGVGTLVGGVALLAGLT